MIIRVGTRPSPLALKQAEEICLRMPSITPEIVMIETRGDLDKTSDLSGMEESNFFTGELEEALRSGTIDIAVHSAKDLEKNIPEDLPIAAITDSLSTFECLVSREGGTLEELPVGASVGTSSYKRRQRLIVFRPDLKVKPIRGNIHERLVQLDRGDFDAIIVAHAALIRLGLEHRIAQVISPEILEPHPLQGRLAVQIRRDRQDMAAILRSLDAR